MKWSERICLLIRQYKAVLAYLFFGACSMLVNVAVYELCYSFFQVGNVPSTAIAWLAAVIFAFFTNKLWVFESRGKSRQTNLHEFLTFFGCRIATGLLDIGIMWLSVDHFHWNEILWKVLSNLIVIILNYAASKLLVFKTK